MAPNQSLLFYLQTTSLDRKQQMIASTAQVARFKELQKQKMIIDVIAESTIFKTPLEDGAVEPQFPLLRVTQGDLEAWYEIIDKLPAIQIRRVYCLADYDYVQSVLHKAQLKWPESKESESNSSEYWESNPAIAIRHCFSGPTPVTGILYQMRGRGDVGIVLPQLEEKLTFLRQQFVDAYFSHLQCLRRIRSGTNHHGRLCVIRWEITRGGGLIHTKNRIRLASIYSLPKTNRCR